MNKTMKISDILERVVRNPATYYQFLHDCIVNARIRNRTKEAPQHTRVEFATTLFQPGDALSPASAKYVGIIVWIPREVYEETYTE